MEMHEAASPDGENLSPTACARAAPYYSINPGLFDSEEHWSYRDLQRLAKRLGLIATGKRSELCVRLQAWHRQRRRNDQTGKFMGVEVRESPGGQQIAEHLLSPLKRPAGSPGSRPCLSSASKLSARGKGSVRRRLDDDDVSRSPLRPARAANVAFSPFNQVKVRRDGPTPHPRARPDVRCVRVQLIPSKEHSEMYQQYVEPSWPDDDELDADADLLADDDDPLFAVVSA